MTKARRVVVLVAVAIAGAWACADTTYVPRRVPSFDTRADRVVAAEDAAAPRPATVDLATALFEALYRSPSIAAAGEHVRQAASDVTTASLVPNPVLSLSTSLQPLPGKQFSPTRPGGPTQYDLLLQQQIDPLVFGKRSAATEAAKRGVDVARADYAEARRARAVRTADAFYDVLVAKEQVIVTADAVDQLERVEKLIAGRVSSGDTAIIDLDRARLNTRVARRESREALVALAQARAELQAMMGRGFDDPAFDVSGELETADLPSLPTREAALASAGERRPDIESARREVERAEAALTSARREGLPTLALQLGATYQYQHPLGQTDAKSFGGGLAVSLPTFDRNQGAIAGAESKLREARFSLDALMVATQAELDQILAEYAQAGNSLNIDSRESVEAARDVRDRIQASYREGGSTLLELLDAQRSYQDAIHGRLAILSRYWHARVALDAAMGRDIAAEMTQAR